MAGSKKETFSRRRFLRTMGWAPFVFSSAPLFASQFRPLPSQSFMGAAAVPFSGFRITPHYPTKSPFDDVFRLVTPGSDEYITEKYAYEIMPLRTSWSIGLKTSPPALAELTKFIHPAAEITPLHNEQEITLRSGNGIDVVRRKFAQQKVRGQDEFLRQIRAYFSPLVQIETAEFEIVGVEDRHAGRGHEGCNAAGDADREQCEWVAGEIGGGADGRDADQSEGCDGSFGYGEQ